MWTGMEFQRYLPEVEAAELLGSHYREIRDLAKSGMLDFIVMPTGCIQTGA